MSYLQNRKQYVIFNKTESEYKDISCGVPQGSILGPLLFILYINDFEHVSDMIKPILFADDTSLFHSHICFNTLIQEVNIQLHKFSTWFNTYKLSLNTKKSNFIIFTPNGKKYNISEAEINIDGSKIKHVKCTKFLGIIIDEHLDWKVHIGKLSNKIARNVGMPNKRKHFLPVYIMKTLYSSLIESHLQYCTLLWANSHVTNIRKLQLLQKKAIRIITSSHYIAHTDPLFSITKLLKLDDMYTYQLGIFMHKVKHFQLPQHMSSMFLRTENIHKHKLRNQNAYYIQQIRTNTRKSTIHFSGPTIWNTLPANLRKVVCIRQFKKKFKQLLLTKFP